MRKLLLLAILTLTVTGMISSLKRNPNVKIQNVKYEIVDNYAQVLAPLSLNSNITILDSEEYKSEWYPVTKINRHAFSTKEVTADSLTIGANVRLIREEAFVNFFASNTGAWSYRSLFRYVNSPSIEAWCSIEFEDPYASPFFWNLEQCERDTLGYDYPTLCIAGVPMTHLRFPESIDTVKNCAFYNYRHLQSVTLPANVKVIGAGSFLDCDSLHTVYIESATPSMLPETSHAEYSFSKETLQSGILYVPKGSAESYRNDAGWQQFLHIEEYTPSDVDEIATPSAEVRVKVSGNTVSFEGGNGLDGVTVFDISGRTVYSGMAESLTLPRGIYLLRTKARTIKFKV